MLSKALQTAGLWLVLVCAFGTAAHACRGLNDDTLNVGVRKSAPFVVFDDTRHAEGLAIEIWEDVLEDLVRAGVATGSEYVICETIGDQRAALVAGDLDVVISPLTITARRMLFYDFSQQYLGSGLTLAEIQSGAIDFELATSLIIATVTQPGVVRAVLLFLGFNLLLAICIRAALRSGGGLSPVEGEGRLVSGIKYLLEAIVRTAGLKGVGDAFSTTFGKLLEIFMAVVGTALSATVLGVLTSAFVGASGQSGSLGASHLPDHRIATLADSTAETFVENQYEERGLVTSDGPVCVEAGTPLASTRGCVLYKTWGEAVTALAAGEVEYVLGDWVALSFHARSDLYRNRIAVHSQVFQNEPYGWGIAPGQDDLRREIDRSLISQMRQPSWRKRIESFLGAGAISPE